MGNHTPCQLHRDASSRSLRGQHICINSLEPLLQGAAVLCLSLVSMTGSAQQPESSPRDTSQPLEVSGDAALNHDPARPLEPEASAKQPDDGRESWLDRIEVEGDLRYRIEIIDAEDKELRYRHRLRARLGVTASVLDDLDGTVKLGTGETDDPVSNNQSLTDAFASKPIWLDLAYVHYHPSFLEGLHFTAGKLKSRFERVGKSELLWDSDLHPEGMELSYQPDFGIIEPFINTAAYFVEERKEDDDAWLIAAQTGLKVTPLDDGVIYGLLGAGYYDYLNVKDQPVFWDPEDSFGNSYREVPDDEGELAYLVYDKGFKMWEGFAEIGGKAGPFPWSAFGTFVVNWPASDNNVGWLVGASFGKTAKPLDFALRYIYRQQHKDAVIGVFTDSDFIGGGTNGMGHEINASFQPAKRITFAVSYFYNQTPIDESEDQAELELDYHRAQFDFQLEL